MCVTHTHTHTATNDLNRSHRVVDDFFWRETICNVCEIHIHTNLLITIYDSLEVCVLHTPIPTPPPMTCIVPTALMSFVLDKAMELRRLNMVLWGRGAVSMHPLDT
jgi:hypothetical protein